ncbi:MAG: hypothetical protein U0X93_17455 [Anaerolineales bacterium]
MNTRSLWDYIEFMHNAMKAMGGSSLAPKENGNGKDTEKEKRPPIGYQLIAAQLKVVVGRRGDVSLPARRRIPARRRFTPQGTADQRVKFLSRFNGDKPTFAAMCITEAGAEASTTPPFARARCWTKRPTSG